MANKLGQAIIESDNDFESVTAPVASAPEKAVTKSAMALYHPELQGDGQLRPCQVYCGKPGILVYGSLRAVDGKEEYTILTRRLANGTLVQSKGAVVKSLNALRSLVAKLEDTQISEMTDKVGGKESVMFGVKTIGDQKQVVAIHERAMLALKYGFESYPQDDDAWDAVIAKFTAQAAKA